MFLLCQVVADWWGAVYEYVYISALCLNVNYEWKTEN